ncbi:MAG: BCD family MFS transporter [Pseudomonadota bacterium]
MTGNTHRTAPGSSDRDFGWLGIIRLGLVQTAIGAIVVLTTSTLNRVMVVELALPAALPGALVGWHYAVQLARPRFGYGADRGGQRAPWIFGGMVVLGLGAVLATLAAMVMAGSALSGTALAIFAFFLIGIGVGASGTNLLALLATHTRPARKAAAAAIVWIMMIVGFVLTAGIGGSLLDPFSMGRLLAVASGIVAIAITVTGLALWGLEGRLQTQGSSSAAEPASEAAPASKPDFRRAFREVWADDQARRFTVFVFVSMLAYSAQDLILEPFAGLVYDYTPGESTKLAGTQNSGVLLGMILTALIGTTIGKSRAGFMRGWTVFGCVASALALGTLSIGAMVGPAWPLKPSVFALGLANGMFAVAAIGSMMTLASAGASSHAREGTRMGLWGAAQATAFGLGGFAGALAIDVTRSLLGEIAPAFASVFAVEGGIFVIAAWLALRVGRTDADERLLPAIPTGETLIADQQPALSS